MKTKKFNKKLTLNKQTVADLNKKEMGYLNGGGPVTPKCIFTESCNPTDCCPTDCTCTGTNIICPCVSEKD